MMNAKTKVMLKTIVICLGSYVQADANPSFFQDKFSNGVATQAESENPHKWIAGTSNLTGDGSTAEETGGQLMLTAKNSSGSVQPEACIYYRELDSAINFWTKPASFVVSGLQRSGSASGDEQNFYITIMSKSVNPRSGIAAAKLELRIFGGGDYVRFGWHSNLADHLSNWNLINSVLVSNSSATKNQIKDITLTLDGTGNQLRYDISFPYTGINTRDSNGDGFVDANDTGMGALSGLLSVQDTAALKTNWLSDNGVSATIDAKGALAFSARRTSSNSSLTATAQIENAQAFEPLTKPMFNDFAFEDEFDNGNPVQVYREAPEKWEIGINNVDGETSAVAETDGKLILTAANAGGGQAEANIYFKTLDPELNFWQQPVAVKVQDIYRQGTAGDSVQNFYITISAGAGNPTLWGNPSPTGPKVDLRFGLDTPEYVAFRWTANFNDGHLYNIHNNFFATNNYLISSSKNGISDIFLALDGTGTQLTYKLSFKCRDGVSNTKDTNHDGVIDCNDTGLSGLSGILSETETTQLRNAWLSYQNQTAASDLSGSLALASRRTDSSSNTSVCELGKVQVFNAVYPQNLRMDRYFHGANIEQQCWSGSWVGLISGGDWSNELPLSRSISWFNYVIDSSQSSPLDFIGNEIGTELMSWGGVENVLSTHVLEDDPVLSAASRIQLNWFPETSVNELLTVFYVKLEDSILTKSMKYNGQFKWRVLAEYREMAYPGDALRSYMGINATAQGLCWYGYIEEDGGKLEEYNNYDVPIPAGKWFLMAVYYKHHETAGAFEAKIRVCKDGGGFEGPWRTLFYFKNVRTTNGGGFDFANFLKIYVGLNVIEDAKPEGISQEFYRIRMWTN